jgi:hypothetical protein
LTWNEPVDREEVEHIGEDETNNGDYPADSYEIEVIGEEEDDENEEDE